MTLNMLLDSISEDIKAFDFRKHREFILSKRYLSTELLLNKNFDEEKFQRYKAVITKQMQLYRRYYTNQEKLNRVYDILEKAKDSYDEKDDKINIYFRVLNKALSILNPRFGKGIFQILKAELKAVNKKDAIKLRYYVERERLLLLKLKGELDPLSFRFENFQGIKSGLSAGVPSLIAAIIFMNLALETHSLPQNKIEPATQIVGMVQEQEKTGDYLMIPKEEGDHMEQIVISYEKFLEMIRNSDIVHEGENERMFQEMYKVNLRGSFTQKDLEDIEKYINEGIGLEEFINKEVREIAFAPKSSTIKRFSKDEHSSNVEESNIGALTHGHTITLISGKEKSAAQISFFHEYGHQVHFRVEDKDPKFNEEWKRLGGVYVNAKTTKADYSMESYQEDIAVLVSVVLSEYYNMGGIHSDLKLDDLISILKPINGTMEELKAKVYFLAQHRFFPAKLGVPSS